jgi:crossover junction endodeoxyribonuclease RuvC
VEIVFVNVNPQSTLLLGQARGACVTALVACDLTVAEYTALQMKKAVAGHGQAGKAEVQEMVRRLLDLPGVPGQGRGRRAGHRDHARAGGAVDGAAGPGGRVVEDACRNVPAGALALDACS